jgi:hypothetical protein
VRSTTADEPPLASFVLRVTGRPATLQYELHDLRTGERHRFRRAEALAAFVRARGLPVEPLQSDDDGMPG